MGEIEIPREVAETLEEIRQSGETNMWDFDTVLYLADERGAHGAVAWLKKHRAAYPDILTSLGRGKLG